MYAGWNEYQYLFTSITPKYLFNLCTVVSCGLTVLLHIYLHISELMPIYDWNAFDFQEHFQSIKANYLL